MPGVIAARGGRDASPLILPRAERKAPRLGVPQVWQIVAGRPRYAATVIGAVRSLTRSIRAPTAVSFCSIFS